MFEEKTINIQSLTPASYMLQRGKPTGRLYILCHGFMSTNKRMWDRFQSRLPENANILAPNSPFPIPIKEESSWKIGYSWFFYDNFQDFYLVDYEICKSYISHLVSALGFDENPKTVIGFSQGGYASVHMAESLNHVDHVIGLGCRFKKLDEVNWSQNLRVDALHGEADDVVDCQGAKEDFLNVPEKNRGNFESFAGVGHKPSAAMLDLAVKWAQEI